MTTTPEPKHPFKRNTTSGHVNIVDEEAQDPDPTDHDA